MLALVPKRVLRWGGGAVITVNSSNLGVINPAAGRPDGTDADYFAISLHYPGTTTTMMSRAGECRFLSREARRVQPSSQSLLFSRVVSSRMRFYAKAFRAS